jgi:hypothetical protein
MLLAAASQNHTPGPKASALDYEDVLLRSFKVFQTIETRDQTLPRYVLFLAAPYQFSVSIPAQPPLHHSITPDPAAACAFET